MSPCFATGCKSGYNGATHRAFRPDKSAAQQWISILKKIRSDTEFDINNRNHVLCEQHFNPIKIVKVDSFVIKGEIVEMPRKNWKLQEGTIPTIFQNLPSYRQVTSPKKRKLPAIRASFSQSKIKRVKIEIPEVHCVTLMDMESICSQNQDWIATERNVNDQKTLHLIEMTFENCCRIKKNIIIHPTGTLDIYFEETNVTKYFSNPNSGEVTTTKEHLQSLFDKVQNCSLCTGVNGYQDIKGHRDGVQLNKRWFSITCKKIVPDGNMCINCKKLGTGLMRKSHILNSKLYRKKVNLYAKFQNLKRKTKTMAQSMGKLKTKILSLQTELRTLNKEVLWKSLQKLNLPKETKMTMYHAVKLAHSKSAKGMRYTTDWLLECMLLRIKSPSAYQHLRSSKLLPLPHRKTLQKLIQGVPCEFGFNPLSLDSIKNEMNNKNRRDRQGCLIFDEIQLRETVDFNTATMKFDGFIDYADYTDQLVDENDKEKLADHALVLLYRPINANWTQPIAAFATKGAAKGTALQKVVIEAILKLEERGAEVLSVICDGAKTNKSFWKGMGITGRCGAIKNKIHNPFDESRYIYFTSDVPHIFKCIRNFFMKHTTLLYKGKEIEYKYYEKLYSVEDEMTDGKRLCPKLKHSHVAPNNFEKMVVSLCTQLFSRTVATAIKTLRELKYEEFISSETTEKFTLTLNNLFDCLNTRTEKDCKGLGQKQTEIISNFLQEINKIENIDKSSRTKHDRNINTFASTETMASLRVTLQSTLDMIEYLKKELQYSYVLTAKFNQDCLELFFGLIRAAGGREDHPTVGSFLKLYRLLSFYTPCKRTVRGNVQTSENETLGSAFKDSLHRAAGTLKAKKIEKKKNVEEILMKKMVELERNQNSMQNCQDSPTNDVESNIVYQLCGYLVRRYTKMIDCEGCKKSLEGSGSQHGVDVLLNNKNFGGLIHPSTSFYELIRFSIEPPLSALLKEKTYYGEVLFEVIQNIPFIKTGVGCSNKEHIFSLLCKIVPDYIIMRFNFYCRSYRNALGHGKATKCLRKKSKLFAS